MARMIRAKRTTAGARVIEGPVADALRTAQEIRTAAQRRSEALAQDIRAAAQRDARAALAAEYVKLARTQRAQAEALQGQVIDVAMGAAARLLGQQLTIEPSAAVAIVRPLLAKLPGAMRVAIHVHPEDLGAVRAWLVAEDAPRDALQVVAHSDVTRGGCIVESDVGSLDARVETRLSALREQLAATPASDAGPAKD